MIFLIAHCGLLGSVLADISHCWVSLISTGNKSGKTKLEALYKILQLSSFIVHYRWL